MAFVVQLFLVPLGGVQLGNGRNGISIAVEGQPNLNVNACKRSTGCKHLMVRETCTPFLMQIQVNCVYVIVLT